MPDAPKSATLLDRVQSRLRTESVARAIRLWSFVVLGLAITAVLAVRLLGLVPPGEQRPVWLLTIPAAIAVLAGIFHHRIKREAAARALDQHANTHDLFLTLTTLSTSAGEYQPLVAESAERQAERIQPDDVIQFNPWPAIGKVCLLASVLAIAILVTPQLDPFGKVEAATRQDEQQKEVAAIRKANEDRAEQLKKKQQRADEASEEINDEVSELKKSFRNMQPTRKESNTKVLTEHRQTLSEQWKAVSNDQLRKMMSQPISEQQIGSSRTAKMNEWLKDLQNGKTESLQKELQKAQETMQAMMEAKDPEERKKLASQLKRELQDLKKFSSEKAGSRELSSALSKAMKALDAASDPKNADQQELTQDAMEALKESLELSDQELEQVAQSAKDLKKLEDALKTLQQAQQLNKNGQLDGEQCEGCQSLDDYAELYAQMMGPGSGSGDKDRNEGGGGGVGRGGETPEDDSDPEGYKSEKSKTQIKAGKVLLAIKTKEYAEEVDFDPDAMRQYQEGIQSVKDGVQSAIENEQIPPGYVDGIKSYFDKIESVDPKLNPPATSGE
jgi:hypothetical protein